jgi:hypothetical protein
MKTVSAVLCGIALGFVSVVQAQFTLFDNFNGYTPGASLIGQGPAGNLWNQTIGAATSTTGQVVRASSDGLATYVGPTLPIAAYRALGPAGLTLANSSTASTVFWQFSVGSTVLANNWNFVVTDVNPIDTAGSSEVQFNYDSTAGNFRARNGAAFKNLSVDGTAAGNVQVVAGMTYNVWFEINNNADTYSVYLQSDGVPGLSARTQVFANDGTGGIFGFRNGAAANDLINVNFGSGNGQPNTTMFDNIYIDPSGFNSLNPVPEPSTWALLTLGSLTLLLVRRKRS